MREQGLLVEFAEQEFVEQQEQEQEQVVVVVLQVYLPESTFRRPFELEFGVQRLVSCLRLLVPK